MQDSRPVSSQSQIDTLGSRLPIGRPPTCTTRGTPQFRSGQLSINIFAASITTIHTTFAMASNSAAAGLEIGDMEARATIDNNVDITPPSRLR